MFRNLLGLRVPGRSVGVLFVAALCLLSLSPAFAADRVEFELDLNNGIRTHPWTGMDANNPCQTDTNVLALINQISGGDPALQQLYINEVNQDPRVSLADKVDACFGGSQAANAAAASWTHTDIPLGTSGMQTCTAEVTTYTIVDSPPAGLTVWFSKLQDAKMAGSDAAAAKTLKKKSYRAKLLIP